LPTQASGGIFHALVRKSLSLRVSYKSLEHMEHAGAAYATAQTLLEDALELMQNGSAHLGRAHRREA